jgi:hypothetical protein
MTQPFLGQSICGRAPLANSLAFVSVTPQADLPRLQGQFYAATAANRHDGQITSDFPKSCQAQEPIGIKNILLSFSPKSAA